MTLPSFAEELLGGDGVDPLPRLLVRRGDPEGHRVRRPRLTSGPRLGRLRHDLELGDRRRALAGRGAEAVGAGVAAADDHDVLAGRDDLVLDLFAERDPVGLGQELHRLVDAAELTARHRQVARVGGAHGEHHGVVALAQPLGGQVVLADRDAGPEDGALTTHLVDALVEVLLLHLELGDAVAQQPADLVGALVDRHGVAGPGQLLGGRKSGRARSRPPRPCDPRATPAAGDARSRGPRPCR